jgi:hypothetical protein
MSGKSRLEYIERHEDINACQSISVSGGKHGSVIVYNHVTSIARKTTVIIIDKDDNTGGNGQH